MSVLSPLARGDQFLDDGRFSHDRRRHSHGMSTNTSWRELGRFWLRLLSAEPAEERGESLRHVITSDQVMLVVDAAPSIDTASADTLRHIRGRLVELMQRDMITPRTAIRATAQIIRALPGNSVFPHVTADENGEVALYWLAGEERLEVLVPERGELYCRASGPDPTLCFEGFFAVIPVPLIRAAIHAISATTRRKNKSWRQVFEAQ